MEGYWKKALDSAQKAIEHDQRQEYSDALTLYTRAIEWLQQSIKYDKNPKTVEMCKQKMDEYLTRAELIKKLQKPEAEGAQNESSSIDTTILAEKPNVRWSDVAGLEHAKRALQEAAIAPMRLPHLFKQVDPWMGILLYGPPGTGKSYLAKALATEADCTFFSVSASDIVTKWVGDSEKLVKSLFDRAREKKPSIIFIDEIDSMCVSRDSSSNSSGGQRLLTEFLIQMQGVGKDNSGVLVVGATNLPWLLDPGIIRRLEQKIYIPLPDLKARAALIRHACGFDAPQQLAEMTEGFSGADLSTAIRNAKMQPVRQVMEATHWHITQDGQYCPARPGAAGAIEMDWMSVPPHLLVARQVDMADYLQAFGETKKSVSGDLISRYERWTEEFGKKG